MRDTKVIVAYIPGSSGLEDHKRIADLQKLVGKHNHSFTTLCSWQNSEDLQRRSISEILDYLDTSIKKMCEEGYEQIYVIAKSFGGALALMRFHPSVSRMVLWAPIPRTGATDIALSDSALEPLRNLKSFEDITISSETYATIKCPILLVRGSNDQIVSKEQIDMLQKVLPQAEIFEIAEMAHSPSTQDEMNYLASISIDFLLR